jgi:peroxiredoxin
MPSRSSRSDARAETRRSRRAAGTAGLALLAALALASAATAVAQGEKAPAFSAPKLQGQGELSLADYRGKVVYLDFWASWCAPCAQSLPAIEALRREFGADEFQVLAVNVDRDPQAGRTFMTRRPVGYPSVSDPQGELPVRFGVETMPTSFLIDRNGVIRYVHQGFRKTDVDALRAKIRELVAQRR